MDVYKLIDPDGQATTRAIARVKNKKQTTLEVGTAVIRANSRVPDDGFSCHEHTEVSVILEGKIDVMSGGKMHHLSAGDLVVVPASEPHYTVATEDTRLIYAFFGEDAT